jgi:hypothetical protein
MTWIREGYNITKMWRRRDVKRGYNGRTINDEGVGSLMVMGGGKGGGV